MAGLVKSGIRTRGFGEVRTKLSRLSVDFPRETGKAAKAEMEIEKKESMRRTPVSEGAPSAIRHLRDTHEVTEPVIHGGIIDVQIHAGGDDAPHGLIVHEDLEMNHPRGGQAKFLESTIKESAPYMAERIARRINVEKMVK